MCTALDRDLTAVRLDRPFGDGQPETRPASIPRTGFIETKEPIKDPRAVLSGDARAVVGDGEQRLVSMCVHANVDRRLQRKK